MPKLLYQGHGSFRLISDHGSVIYIDPFAGSGYDKKADLILVSHNHHDHNQISLCALNDDGTVLTYREFLKAERHHLFLIKDITVFAVAAYNKNHKKSECVGFIINIDGVKIYFSGDTSTTDEMAVFKDLALDYAILCGDGYYNMDLIEAANCAKLIKAKHNIIAHLKPGALFDEEMAEKWDAPNKIILKPTEEINL